MGGTGHSLRVAPMAAKRTNQPDAGAAIAAAAFLQKCSDPHFAPQPISPERSFAAQHFDNPAIGQN